MRYAPNHKEETREKLLESSRAIAKKGGFSSTGVDALMSAIGLTGGAFYSHFGSKGELFAALIEREMENSAEMLAGTPDSPPDDERQSRPPDRGRPREDCGAPNLLSAAELGGPWRQEAADGVGDNPTSYTFSKNDIN